MRKKIIVRLSNKKLEALTWLKSIYNLKYDDEVLDLAFEQLLEATRALEERIRKETPDLVKKIQEGAGGEDVQ